MGLLWSSCEPSRIAVGKKSTEHLRIDTGRPRTPPPDRRGSGGGDGLRAPVPPWGGTESPGTALRAAITSGPFRIPGTQLTTSPQLSPRLADRRGSAARWPLSAGRASRAP